jgi:hypothetical protein
MSTTPDGVNVGPMMNCSFFRLRFFRVISQISNVHAPVLQVLHERGELLAVRRLRPLHEEIHTLGVGDGDELGLRVGVRVVAHVAQSLHRLRKAAVEVIDHLVLRHGGERGE